MGIFFAIIFTWLIIEVTSLVSSKTTIYEKFKVWWIVRTWIKNEIDPVYKTCIYIPVIESTNILGTSDYDVYCTFKLGDVKKTWTWVLVQDGIVNNKREVNRILKEEFSENDLLKQKRKNKLKGLLK